MIRLGLPSWMLWDWSTGSHPPYAARIVIELFRISLLAKNSTSRLKDIHLWRVLYNGKDLTTKLTFCKKDLIENRLWLSASSFRPLSNECHLVIIPCRHPLFIGCSMDGWLLPDPVQRHITFRNGSRFLRRSKNFYPNNTYLVRWVFVPCDIFWTLLATKYAKLPGEVLHEEACSLRSCI